MRFPSNDTFFSFFFSFVFGLYYCPKDLKVLCRKKSLSLIPSHHLFKVILSHTTEARFYPPWCHTKSVIGLFFKYRI